jgi:hypothetical protein
VNFRFLDDRNQDSLPKVVALLNLELLRERKKEKFVAGTEEITLVSPKAKASYLWRKLL